MLPIENLLPRLQNVRTRGKGSWIACCPAHDDRNPSLSIREIQDGSLLLNCFGQQCPAAAVLTAVGLELRDLYPQPSQDTYDRRRRPPHTPPFPWSDALKNLRHHLQVVQLGAARLALGDELDKPDLDALGRAALSVYELLEEIK